MPNLCAPWSKSQSTLGNRVDEKKKATEMMSARRAKSCQWEITFADWRTFPFIFSSIQSTAAVSPCLHSIDSKRLLITFIHSFVPFMDYFMYLHNAHAAPECIYYSRRSESMFVSLYFGSTISASFPMPVCRYLLFGALYSQTLPPIPFKTIH